ncbi:hypothetical protein RhiirA4_513740 [Rhizophagus irregularis]|uniref:Uncharacterized protein n=1 Tax=Rhizophagus irregularis TaxID=588596 RepID=A0A2I1HIZ6_9GLOM|nr:hypothetical protein RhiirA4_513740 [Rhizophagus irregularis]
MAIAEENEFYSKLCVARTFKGAVEEKREKEINLSGVDKFSYNLATILARDREVVAVNLRALSDGCEISIAKNSVWLDKDREYVEKIKETLKNVSKDAPMSFKQACGREDMRDLILTIVEYCSEKLRYTLNKLRWDITEYEDKVYTKSFLDYVKTKINDVDIFDKIDVLNNEEKYTISSVCCKYYKIVKQDFEIPKKFRNHTRKVGSYIESLFNIVNCVRNTKYKDLFFRIDLKLLNPDVVIQPILPWNGIVKKFLDHEKEYEGFMEECLKDPTIGRRLKHMYGGVDAELNCVSSNEVYLHAELNLLTSVMNHEEKRIFIAVSKKCCYLCELYIRYVQEIKGYNVAFSGSHKSLKKLCSRWKLPDTFKKEFMSYAQLELDRIIEYEIKLCTEPDSELECIEAYLNSPFYHNF